jgi:hypothetical protein
MTDVELVINKLSPAERTDLLHSLIRREQDRARSMAVVMAAALAANLKPAGYPELAQLTATIEATLLERAITMTIGDNCS